MAFFRPARGYPPASGPDFWAQRRTRRPDGNRKIRRDVRRRNGSRPDALRRGLASSEQRARLFRTTGTTLPDKSRRPAEGCFLPEDDRGATDVLLTDFPISTSGSGKSERNPKKTRHFRPSLSHSAYFLLFPNAFWLRFFRPPVPSYAKKSRKTRQNKSLAGYSPTFSNFATDTQKDLETAWNSITTLS